MQFIWGGKIYWFWFFFFLMFSVAQFAVRNSSYYYYILSLLFLFLKKIPLRVVIKLSFPGTRVSRVSNTITREILVV